MNSGLFLLIMHARARLLFLRTVISFKSFFGFPNRTTKRNPKNPDVDFLIEIHPEDGLLGGEICFRISRSIGKSGFRFWKSKSRFPNRTHPKCPNSLTTKICLKELFSWLYTANEFIWQPFFLLYSFTIYYHCQTQKTVNTWKISGMLIVYWPITIKFRIHKQTSKPQTNYHCCWWFSYLAPYWLISCNTITFHKYFWCSWFCEFHSNKRL